MGKYFLFEISLFLTAILHRGLRNDFFFIFFSQFTFSNFYLDLYFPFLFGLLFLFSLLSLDFLPLLFLDFYFRFIFVLILSYFGLISYFRLIFVLLSPYFVLFLFYFRFPFSIWTFIQSRSHFGFLPNFFSNFRRKLLEVKKHTALA